MQRSIINDNNNVKSNNNINLLSNSLIDKNNCGSERPIKTPNFGTYNIFNKSDFSLNK